MHGNNGRAAIMTVYHPYAEEEWVPHFSRSLRKVGLSTPSTIEIQKPHVSQTRETWGTRRSVDRK